MLAITRGAQTTKKVVSELFFRLASIDALLGRCALRVVEIISLECRRGRVCYHIHVVRCITDPPEILVMHAFGLLR